MWRFLGCLCNGKWLATALQRKIVSDLVPPTVLQWKWLVKPKTGMNKVKFAGVQVTAAVIKGKIRMWKYVEGKWNGNAAVSFVTGIIGIKGCPQNLRWLPKGCRHIGAT